MLRILLILACCCCSFFSFAQTQSEVNEAKRQAFLQADKELNQVYRMLLKEYKGDTAFIRNFKVAQKAWVQFRDAEIAAVFPEAPEASMESTCRYLELAKLTKQRTRRIREWLNGVKEGEICGGSMKIRE